jgi:hypothetical protein
MQKIIKYMLVFCLVSCAPVKRSYDERMDGYIGNDINNVYWFQHKKEDESSYEYGYPVYVGTYQTTNELYEEHAMKFVS